jgi:hypothetical protein
MPTNFLILLVTLFPIYLDLAFVHVLNDLLSGTLIQILKDAAVFETPFCLGHPQNSAVHAQ